MGTGPAKVFNDLSWLKISGSSPTTPMVIDSTSGGYKSYSTKPMAIDSTGSRDPYGPKPMVVDSTGYAASSSTGSSLRTGNQTSMDRRNTTLWY